MKSLAFIYGSIVLLLCLCFPLIFGANCELRLGSIVVLTGDRPRLGSAAGYAMGVDAYLKGHMNSSYIDKYAQLVSGNASAKCNISIDTRDMKSDIKEGIVIAFDLSESFGSIGGLNVPIILGPPTSTYALTLNPLIEAFNLIQFSSTATSTFLSEYPHFYRSVPSDDLQAKALIELCSHFSWNPIGIMYVNSDYGSSLQQAIIKYAVLEGIATTTFSFIDGDDVTITDAVTSMKQSQILIFILILYRSDASFIGRKLSANGMDGYPYYYIGTDSFVGYDIGTDSYDYSWKGVLPFYGGMIGTCPWSPRINDPFLLEYPDSVATSISNYKSLYERWNGYYQSDPNNTLTFGMEYPDKWAPYAYDNVLAVVSALNLHFSNKNHTSVNVSALDFTRTLWSVSVIGLTGKLSFSELGDRDDGLISFCNINPSNGASFTVGFIVDNVDSVSISNDGILWPKSFNGETPKSEYKWYNGVPRYLFILAWTLSLLSMIATLFLMFCLWFYRERKIIRASQWRLSCLMGVGVCIAYVCIILFGIDEATEAIKYNINWTALCNARMVLLNIAFCATFGPLFCKVYRIKLIFTVGVDLKRVVLTDAKMASYNMIYVLIELILVVIIVAAVPYSREYNIENARNIRDSSTQYWGSCTTQFQIVYFLVLALPKLVLALYCIVISISVYSSVSMMKFNEGLQVLISVVISILLILMLVTVASVITIESAASSVFFYGFFTLILLLVCNFSIVIMLMPRIVAIWKNQEDEYNQEHDAMSKKINKYISRVTRVARKGSSNSNNAKQSDADQSANHSTTWGTNEELNTPKLLGTPDTPIT